ncbi:PIG-P domain-containing protein [Plasmodiophora brassicae]|uniref:PIG-P domain-containing protein n=1 Tax=Plasmodiophora brassicae TaxID=37360 RepID=A0A0G4J3H1_PLABS|nr:hypothetical protein PBRA_002189 [Plasmodiophora brassicae]SPQ98787.1 unnamed protein product [Plasmodiophora brassicae]
METASGAVSHPRPALAIEPVPTAKGEVAGFVLWIASYVSFVLFLLWAFIPERILHRAGVYYYPSKYWALSVPAYLCSTFVFIILFYIAVNFCMTNPLQSRFTYTDKFSVLMTKKPRCSNMVDFEEIRDIPLPVINKILYQTKSGTASPKKN